MLLVQQDDAARQMEQGVNSPITSTLAWLKGVVARPNPALGRSGSVCPFVPRALQLSVLWFNELRLADLPCELAQLRDKFFTLEPTDPERRIGKTILLIVPDMPVEFLTEGTWLTWLASYLEVGLKITAFHPKNPQTGIHNLSFLSHVSPFPILAIRHLHLRDIAFVTQLVGTREGELLKSAYTRVFKV